MSPLTQGLNYRSACDRKSYTRFRLVPKSTTLDDPELTLNGYYSLFCITDISFGAHHKNLNEDRPYYRRQKCSPRIAVCSKIRLMRIFAGVRWRGGFKSEWGGRKLAIFAYFTRYIFRTFTSKATIILCSLLVARH